MTDAEQIAAWAAEDAAMMATAQAKAAFDAFITDHGGMNSELADNALGNAFAIEVYAEYADDKARWEAALATAKEYVDQGVTGY